MKILVTGGAGFIGSSFVERCLKSKNNFKIIVIDSLTIGSNINNLPNKKTKNYEFFKGDICDKKILKKLIKKVDLVVNFAAESHVDRSISNSKAFVDTNIIGVHNILELLRDYKNKKLLQVSTDEVYGDIKKGSFKESDPLNPSNPYSASKAAAEMLIKSYQRTYDLNIITTRCVNNFGPHQLPEKLIPKTILSALKNKKIPLHGKGTAIRQWIHVNDHCDAIIQIIQKWKKGSVYNIQGKYEGTNIDVVKQILRLMNKSENLIKFVKDRPGQDQRYAINSSLIKKEIGFKSKIEFNEGLKNTIIWYMENMTMWSPTSFKKISNPTPWSK
jgi:dTDP-glucose 4,6-dehydratase